MAITIKEVVDDMAKTIHILPDTKMIILVERGDKFSSHICGNISIEAINILLIELKKILEERRAIMN